MNETIILVVSSILMILISIIGFFLRKLINNVEQINTSLTGLDLGVKVLNVEFKNNGKDLLELKADVSSANRDFIRRMDKQAEKIEENRDKINILKAEHDNCPVRLQEK